MNPTDNPSQYRASQLWKRFVGMFGGPAVERKYGLEPPPEWVAMMGRLKDFELDRGVRRLAYNGARDVPSLPQFTSLCRAVGDDGIDEGPRSAVALPNPDTRKYDGWALTANNRFCRYVLDRLMTDPRTWGPAGSNEQHVSTQIGVAYKNAWARDMRDAETADPHTGEMVRPPREVQDSAWWSCMERMEAEIAATHQRAAA